MSKSSRSQKSRTEKRRRRNRHKERQQLASDGTATVLPKTNTARVLQEQRVKDNAGAIYSDVPLQTQEIRCTHAKPRRRCPGCQLDRFSRIEIIPCGSDEGPRLLASVKFDGSEIGESYLDEDIDLSNGLGTMKELPKTTLKPILLSQVLRVPRILRAISALCSNIETIAVDICQRLLSSCSLQPESVVGQLATLSRCELLDPEVRQQIAETAEILDGVVDQSEFCNTVFTELEPLVPEFEDVEKLLAALESHGEWLSNNVSDLAIVATKSSPRAIEMLKKSVGSVIVSSAARAIAARTLVQLGFEDYELTLSLYKNDECPESQLDYFKAALPILKGNARLRKYHLDHVNCEQPLIKLRALHGLTVNPPKKLDVVEEMCIAYDQCNNAEKLQYLKSFCVIPENECFNRFLSKVELHNGDPEIRAQLNQLYQNRREQRRSNLELNRDAMSAFC